MPQYGMIQDVPRLLLIIPPLTQLNTPYPATAYLTGFLQEQGYVVSQADLGLETVLRLFSRPGLIRLFEAIRDHSRARLFPVRRAIALSEAYIETIEPVVRFLQGKDPSLAAQITGRRFLPEGPRLRALEEDHWAFGSLGTTDRAKHLASLYLDDLTDLIQATVAPHFGLSRYGERLAASAESFDPLARALNEPPGVVDQFLDEAVEARIASERPDLVGITVPFPGNLYGALRIAKGIRRRSHETRIALGGGYVNTELRSLSEPRFFDLVDYVTLDAGERPLLCLLEHLSGKREPERLRRTFLLEKNRVVFTDGASEGDFPFEQTGTPTYRGLPLDRYLSIVELLNPMHRLWSDGRWNKLTIAHGCYWKKCAFCDVGLDYIKRYEPAPATLLADRIDALIAETGQSGFHFVDEAAPPSRLADLALELLARGRRISWWGNIRFEEAFTPDLCRLLAASGCIAVTGGLEVASDRLLALMEKGITVEQVARVAAGFADAGIMVHAYLMYGFPTETAVETVESLERVRQLFEAGIIHSGFWHRFVATAHSPIGLNPSAYGIAVTGPEPGSFARNDLIHKDPGGCDPDRFGPGLSKAIYNYMHGIGLEDDVRTWFGHNGRRLPPPRVSPRLIANAIETPFPSEIDRGYSRLIWLGGTPWPEGPRQRGVSGESKTGPRRTWIVPVKGEEVRMTLDDSTSKWLIPLLDQASPKKGRFPRLEESELTFPFRNPGAFRRFMRGRAWRELRRTGLLLV
ncbi:MAG TPA: radical SAM protein [Nitrospiria bacterium]|nr:radical SAM protein [Nitrospiria bacterium]